MLGKKASGKHFLSGKWHIPGGKVKTGESDEQALKREMMEELGVEVEVGEMLDVVEFIDKETESHAVSPAFVCHIISGTPTIMEPHKCAEIGWFSWEEIGKMDLSPYAIKDLAGFRRRYPNGIV